MTTDPRAELEARWGADRRVRLVAYVIAWIIGAGVSSVVMSWLGGWPGVLVGWPTSFAVGYVGRPWIVWAATRLIDRHARW